MASWPTQSDYKDALQNPDTAFRDPDLQGEPGRAQPDGRSACPVRCVRQRLQDDRGTKAIALKLFNFPNEDRASRYQAVSDYLKSLGPKKPGRPGQVPLPPRGHPHRQGVVSDTHDGMGEGEVARRMGPRGDGAEANPDLAAVRAMAEAWVQLVHEIQAANIAHGDLQHDNVMVVGITPVLVDYDGMCVPALAPKPTAKPKLEQLEFGKPAYQHPAPAEPRSSARISTTSPRGSS